MTGDTLALAGYAYSGAGRAVYRVDVSIDGGSTWQQATLARASAAQGVRSGKAWAWVQWRHAVAVPAGTRRLRVVCKAVDDQYNQQPHAVAPIWNVRGILNTSWGHVDVQVGTDSRL